MVQDDKHNIFFCVKMVKATRDYFYLEILCPDWDVYQNFLYLKEIIFERVITMTFRNLCPNFQKPPQPSKIPGYAPAFHFCLVCKLCRNCLLHLCQNSSAIEYTRLHLLLEYSQNIEYRHDIPTFLSSLLTCYQVNVESDY